MNKNRIRQRFARAAATYENQATIQVQVADKLLSLLKEHVPRPPRRVLEIGCCTGLLTERIYKLFDEVVTFYINDLVPDFQGRVRKRLDNDTRLVFLPGDIEQLDIPEQLDLIISSSTLHWLADLPSLFRKLDNSLAPGGTVCFSIYGTDNLAEVRKISGIGLHYYSLEKLKTLVGSYFDILASDQEKITLHFDDVLAVLSHLRETGVNALKSTPWTRSRLNSFIEDYTRTFGSKGRVPLTYHPLYCIARKKDQSR